MTGPSFLATEHVLFGTKGHSKMLINAFQGKGKYEKALDMHQKSLDIKIKVAGHDHKEVADSKWNMAMMFETQGKRDEGTLLLDSETLVPISR